MRYLKAFSLLFVLLFCAGSNSRAQIRNESYPAFTLVIRITNYDAAGNVLSVESATRFQSSTGDWRYTGSFGVNTIETLYLRGRGVYVGNSVSGTMIRMSNSAAGCPSVTSEELRRDPKFVRTEAILGYTAYVLREHISSYIMETYFVPALRRIPFKRTYAFADGHKMIEEPISLTMGEPSETDLTGPDYERIEQIPIFNDKLSQQISFQPQPLNPAEVNSPVSIVVQVIVDQTGRVVSARSVTPIPLFDVAAANAAYQAFFSPTMIDGTAVVATGIINYTFKPSRR